jgi:hypothetical protein
METPENVMTAGGAAPSPFRRPSLPKPAPGPGAPVGTPNLAPRPLPTVSAMIGAPPASGASALTTAPLTAEQQQLERRRRLGAGWFYWVAGISLLNALITLAGLHWRFIVGLGTTQVATGLAVRAGRGWATAILLDVVLIGGFAVLGYLALQKHLWAFAVGIAVYGLDGLIFLAVRNWIGLGFHVFVLVMVFKGLQAARQLDAGRT